MSAGVCGKRLGFEEIFGSPSPAPAAKRSRCSRYGSPVHSPDFGIGSDDKLSVLLHMFPSMDREVVETILNSHGHKIDDAIKSLHALCIGDGTTLKETVCLDSDLTSDGHVVAGDKITHMPEWKAEEANHGNLDYKPQNGLSWVDVFVHEMMNALDLNDVRFRAAQMLEAFEKSVITNYTASDKNCMEQQEVISIKEQLQCLLRDNQILKKAVAIQHERSLEQEEKLKEIQQLKHVLGKYQEQIQTLERNNYTLRIHLQRAHESSSIPSRFHPDVF
ncbi:hypothetical protein J5N97_006109 [Dioscorea zingiberensis]|uniref:CUE domain-containing protein n=1 Tax=Dioscorea zingiberensis TaxID=325984 RepID=A0A9D5HT06_9LILI|nr:hypothetical protein J5N97_006109 [Dioscorea zingiberensis]